MTFRILSLDGGGAWALIEVKALIRLFGSDQISGHEVLGDFDLVAANSGGSIVLGGLVENLTLAELLQFFMDQNKRQAIFSPTKSWEDDALEAVLKFGPKYSAAAKLTELENLMPKKGATVLNGITADIPGRNGAPVQLLIVGFDYDYNRATFFRSVPPAAPCLGVVNPPETTLAEAIHASTNAPINYFDAPASFPQHPERYWDGGITGFNNPVLAAVTEAIARDVPPQTIAALSLGTGSVRLPPGAQGQAASAFIAPWQDSGLANDLKKLAASILDDPPDSASFISHAMTKGDGRFPAPAISRVVRMNPLVSPLLQDGQLVAPASMTPSQFQTLTQIDMDAVQATEVNAIVAYAELWLADKAPNQLLHTDGRSVATKLPSQLVDTTSPLPGNDFGNLTFSQALAAWEAISDWQEG